MQGKTILVVEDNLLSLKVVRLALESAGYAVLVATDGREALRILSEKAADLILQDLMLPDIDGMELVQRLRALPNGATIPILALTGFLPKAEQARTLTSRFTDYLFKPIEPSRLLEVVQTRLRPPPAKDLSSGANRRVLVVDDDPLLQKLLALHLEQAGFRVTLAADGEEGLASARRDPPEAIASDIIMPRLDGFRFCHAIREDPALARIPVVLFSGAFADKADRSLARSVGAVALVSRAQGCQSVVDAILVGLRNADSLPPPEEGDFPIGDYAVRLVRQLERQIGRDADLTRRLAMVEAEIALLGGFAEALQAEAPAETVLQILLQRCVSAAGFSKGVVYLADEGERLKPAAWSGFAESDVAQLNEFFGHRPLLEAAAKGSEPLQTPTPLLSSEETEDLYGRMGVRTLLLAPLRHGQRRIGVLAIASHEPHPGEDWHPFARAIGAQMAQATVLALNHARLAASEERYRLLAESEARLGDQLRQSQKMEAIGQLAGGVAHDFNNLLTVILGHSDLLLRRVTEEGPLRGSLFEIRKAAQHAAALTQQLLAFSRRQILQPKILDLNAIVADTESMLRRLIGEDVDLVTILSPRLGKVRADPGQIQQAILNLAVNARDAMPGGGRITLETADARLDEAYAREHPGTTPGDFVMIAMSDTGTGMDEATRARIFEPFFTTKEKGKGTGLGLATVYGVVKQTGGTIWVYSEPGKGSTFKIYLPRVVGDEAGAEAGEAERGSPCGSETILLVEDSDAVRQFAREAVGELGYRIIEARDGEEALVRAEAIPGPIDLLLTDVVMPGMSGRELAVKLATTRPGMKVLYTSGYTDRAIVNQGVLDRGMAFIQKPYTPDLLGRKIREVLDAPAGPGAKS